MPSMNVGRRGSTTSGMHEYPTGHREVRIEVNRIVMSVSIACGSHVYLTFDVRVTGLPQQDSAADSSATKFERYAT